MMILETMLWAMLWLALCGGWGLLGWRVLRLPMTSVLMVLAPAFWLGWVFVSIFMFLGLAAQLPQPAYLLLWLGVLGWVTTWRLPIKQAPCIWAPFMVAGGVMALHLVGASMPPVEADSLAYHFALPKLFVEQGRLVFQPIAVDYAVPLLTQSSWAAALMLGGERAMMALAWLTSGMAAAMVGVLGAQFLSRAWAGWAAVLVLTLPVFSYGFVAGTVELRLVGMVALGLWALLHYQQTKRRGYFWLAGISAGGLVAMKFFGLFLGFLLGVVALVLNRTRPFAQQIGLAVGFAGVCVLVCAPFYGWLWLAGGSPLFPVGCGTVFTCFDWPAAQTEVFDQFVAGTRAGYGQGLLDWLQYPLTATWQGSLFENGRTGVGAVLLWGSVMTAGALWFSRPRIWRGKISPLWLLALVFVGYFALWFFLGASTKVRHLLPVLPLGLLIGMALVQGVWGHGPVAGRWLLRGLLVVVLGLQLAAVAAVNIAAIKAVVNHTPKAAYISQNVAPAAALPLLVNLDENAQLFHTNLRQLNYYLPVQYGYGYPYYQGTVPLMIDTPIAVWQALKHQGYTHWLAQAGAVNRQDVLTQQVLVHADCLLPVGSAATQAYASRTLRTGGRAVAYTLYEIAPSCSLVD